MIGPSPRIWGIWGSSPRALDRLSSPHSLMLGWGSNDLSVYLNKSPRAQSRLPPSFILHVYNQQALWIDSHRSSQSKFIDNCHFQILQLSDGTEYHTLLIAFWLVELPQNIGTRRALLIDSLLPRAQHRVAPARLSRDGLQHQPGSSICCWPIQPSSF